MIIGSPEYFRVRANNNFNQFLRVAYQDILGRALDPIGQATWTAARARGASNADIALAILGSNESNRREVAGYYQEFLRRPPDPGGLIGFTNSLNSGTLNSVVIAAIVGSPEYLRRFCL